MNRSIQKFINFLNEFRRQFEKSIISSLTNNVEGLINSGNVGKVIIKLRKFEKSKVSIQGIFNELDNLTRILSESKEERLQKKEIFGDFPILSVYLEHSDLSDREKYNVIAYFIEKNIESGFLEEDSYTLDGRKLMNHKFKTISSEKVMRMLYDGSLNEFMNRDDEECTVLELQQREEIYENRDLFIKDISDIISHNKVLYERIVNKYTNYTLEDVVIGLEVLKLLGASPEILESVKKHLIFNYEKRLQSETELSEISEIEVCLRLLKQDEEKINKIKETVKTRKKELTQKSEQVQQEIEIQQATKKYLTDKEYKEMKKHIRQVYDAYNMKLLKAVTYEELIHIVSLMLQIDMNEFEIIRFISLAYQEMEETVPSYEDTIAKLNYYYNCEQLETLNSYYEEVKNSIGEDNNFWQNEYLKELKTLTSSIPNGYKYEIEEARKLYQIN